MKSNLKTKGWANPISVSVMLLAIILSLALFALHRIELSIIFMVALGLLSVSMRIADQWEHAVVLRMGKFQGLKGPGVFFILPIIDSVSAYVDQRVRVSSFKAEQTLTKDTVPVNVDAVVYWTVWDVEKAVLEVQDYQEAIEHIAQTGLRDTIGKHELSTLLQERDKIAEDLQILLDQNTNPWGITCQTVGIKDIAIPVEKAVLEVQDYQEAIEHIAQTGLRDTIGKHELSTLLQERDKIAEDLQILLDQNTNPWGITCQTVGIKDIAIPVDLAEAMSKEAQAERERRARVILGTAETEIAEKFAQASKEYRNNPVALHLRGMNMLFEGLKEKGSMVIVPSSALETMNLGAIGGLASLSKVQDDL